MAEIYVNISNFPNYQVSNLGNVKNITTGRILKAGTNSGGYLTVVLSNDGDASSIKVHRLVGNAFIENPVNKECIDHINHNKKDNNVLNLRWATKLENCQNRSISTNNTSGYSGITYVEKSNKWRVKITVNRRPKHLGYFVNKEDAIRVRQEAEVLYFGEFQALI